jgi:hypothetical protein
MKMYNPLKSKNNYCIKRTIGFMSILLIGSSSFGQSDTPCSAPTLPVNATCSYTSGTSVGSTKQTNAANGGTPSCGSMGPDVWYQFVAPPSGGISITTQAGTITDGVMAIYSGPCTAPTEIACNDDANGLMPGITTGGLTPGNTYYIRFWKLAGGRGTFDICITTYTPPPPPPNDNCSNATSLSVNPYNSCTPTSGTVAGATASGTATSCFDTPTDDVWYKFTANNDSIYVSTDVTFDADVEILSSCTASIDCEYFYSSNGTTVLTGLTVGQTYYVRIFSEDPTYNTSSSFTICIKDPPPPPPNDNCANAVNETMSLNGNCSSVSGYVTGATQSGTTPCSVSNTDDVWYKFTATNDSAYINRTCNFDSYVEVRINCGNGAAGSILCADAEGPQLVTGLTVGNTYYYRIYSYFSDPSDGDFTTCITSPVPPAPNIHCPNMAPVCSDTPISFQAQSGGNDADTEDPGNNYDCLSTTPNPTWFYLNIANTGALSIDLSASEDVDFAIWGPYTSETNAQSNCNNYPLPKDCSYSPSATEQVNIPTATAGETYVLLVTNYANVPQQISLSSSSTNTATTDCSIVPLPIELENFEVTQAGMQVELNWATGSETDNDYFDVEKTQDGTKWEFVAKINGFGNSNNEKHYTTEDNHPYIGTSYYRLKQVDQNGNFKYSPVKSVQFEGDNAILIFPQPASHFVNVSWNGFNGKLLYSDFSGKTIQIPTEKKDNGQYQLDVSNLNKGVYFIKFLDAGSVSIKKLIVQ